MQQDSFPSDANSVLDTETGYSTYLIVDYEKYPKLKGKDIVGYDGGLYDVSRFARYHPGGEELLRKFAGTDVSIQIRAFHDKNVMEGREPVGTYVDATDRDPAAARYKTLIEELRKEGFFNASYGWYFGKTLFCFMFLVLAVKLIEIGYYKSAGFAVAFFFQQCGFFMHDFMHNQLTHDRKTDRWLGMFFGTAGLGVGGHWWKEEHFTHHAFTNVCDIPTGWSDPQMREEIWAQNQKLFPFFKTALQGFLINIQHLTWLPVTMLFGRLGIMVDCFKDERRWYEWLAFAGHWMYLVMLTSMIPGWEDRGLFYLSASLGQGVLSVQLLLSHYAKPFFHKEFEYHNTSFPRVMAITTINISNPPWLDWFHGGLNLHLEHHLFPCMPRHHLRSAQPFIKQYCKDVGLYYDECSWWEAILRTLTSLSRIATMWNKQAQC